MALFLAGLGAVACASANRSAIKQTSAESAKWSAAGDFGKGIDIYRGLYEHNPKDAKVLAGYVAALGEVKKAGDRARVQGSYVTAQAAYRTLIDRWDGFAAFTGKLGFRRTEVEAGLKDCRLALCQRIFRQELLAGRYAGALAVYQDAAREYPGDPDAKAMYAKGVGEVRSIGAKALAAKDYALAGKIDGLLLKNLETVEGLGAPAGRGASDRNELTEALRVCAAGLTNLGLAEYRKGNLERAIALWEGLLAFDPGNAEIKKALQTAKAQLGQLKDMAPAGGARGGKSGQASQRRGYYEPAE